MLAGRRVSNNNNAWSESVELNYVLIALLALVLIMASYSATNFPKPTWFGKAIALLVILLIAAGILRVIVAWSTIDTEQVPFEPLARSEPQRLTLIG